MNPFINIKECIAVKDNDERLKDCAIGECQLDKNGEILLVRESEWLEFLSMIYEERNLGTAQEFKKIIINS